MIGMFLTIKDDMMVVSKISKKNLTWIKKHRFAIGVFSAAIILRLIFFYAAFSFYQFDPHLLLQNSQGDAYYNIAENLIEHGAFGITYNGALELNSVRTPGMPGLIALFLWVFKSPWPFLFVQIGVGSLLPLLAMKVIRMSNRFSNTVVHWIAIALAVDPMTIYLSLRFATETYFTLFFLLFVLVVFKIIDLWNNHSEYAEKKLIGWSAACGGLLGIATLFRPTTIYLPLFFILFAIGYALYKKTTSHMKPIAIFCFVFFIVVAPWMHRNLRVFNTFAFSSIAGQVTAHYLAPAILAKANGEDIFTARMRYFEEMEVSDSGEIRADQLPALKNKIIAVITQYPALSIQVLGRNLLTFFIHDNSSDLFQSTGILSQQIEPTFSHVTAQIFAFVKGNATDEIGSYLLIFTLRVLWLLIIASAICRVIMQTIQKKIDAADALMIFFILYFALTTLANGPAANARFRFPVHAFIYAYAVVEITAMVRKVHRN